MTAWGRWLREFGGTGTPDDPASRMREAFGADPGPSRETPGEEAARVIVGSIAARERVDGDDVEIGGSIG